MPDFPPNPYQASAIAPAPPSSDSWGGLEIQLKILGGFNIGIGLLGLGFGGLAVVGNLMDMMNGGPRLPAGTSGNGAMGFWVGFYGFFLSQLLSAMLQSVVIWGGINMLRLKGRNVMWAASIVNIIPILSACCFLGIPFGIWGMILLSNQTVKSNLS